VLSLVLVISFSVFVVFWQSLKEPSEIRSLLVLPVENLTGDAELDYYTDGILDAINNEIGKLGPLRVPSTHTSLHYRDSELSLDEIGQQLKVQAVVEISLIEVGDFIRLRVKIIEIGPEEKQIWSQDFTSSLSQILFMYREVAQGIGIELNVPVPEQPVFQLASLQEVIPQSYEYYIKGMSFWYKLTPEDLDQSLRYFMLAMEADPNYAPAYAGVAMVWGGRIQQGITPGKEAEAEIDSLMAIAMQLAGNGAEVNYAFALYNTWWKWNWEEARKAFEKTIELNPNHAHLRAYYSHYLHISGRREEGIKQINKALELDPVDALIQALYGMDLNYAGQFDLAIDKMTKVLETDPANSIALSTLRSAYHNNKQFDKAYEIFVQSYRVRNDTLAVQALENGYANGNYRTALNSLAEHLIAKSKITYVTPWLIGTIYTRAGKDDEAVKYLKMAYDQHDANLPYIGVDPIFDDLRSHPRFQELVDNMAFPVL